MCQLFRFLILRKVTSEDHGLEGFFKESSEQDQFVRRARAAGCLHTSESSDGIAASYVYVGEAADAFYPELETNGLFRAVDLAKQFIGLDIESVFQDFEILVTPSQKIDFDGSVWARRRKK